MRLLLTAAGSLAGVCALVLAVGLVFAEPGFLVIAATTSKSKTISFVATKRIGLMNECPTEHFKPESPVGFALNGFDLPDVDNGKVLEVADALISAGCDPDRYSVFGLTALHNAVIAGQPALVEYLLKNGAQTDLRIQPVAGQTTGKTIVGLDSWQLAERLMTMDSESRGRATVLELLRQVRAGASQAPGSTRSRRS